MQLQQHYKGIIWTNHALDRLVNRKLDQEIAWQAFQYPERSLQGKQPGTIEYQRRFGNSQVTIIAKQNEKKEWIILSAWVDPPMPGSNEDREKQFQKRYDEASFWRKFWLEIKRQLGF